MTLANAMQRYVEQMGLQNLEGAAVTRLPGVRFFRSTQGNSRQPLTYQSGLLIMGQGHEIIHLGEQQVAYGPDSYLGRVAAVMLGSTETTFYTIAVYSACLHMKDTRYALPAALCGDLAAFLLSGLSVRLLMR